MKKTVRFVCLALLFISVFCSGTYFGKAKASNALFSVLQAYSPQKPNNQIQASTFEEDALYSTVSLLIRFEKEGLSTPKHGTGIVYSLNKKDGNATILTCEHLFREEGFLLSEVQIFLYGLEFSQSA
ncbi:MAG: hypothetical protein J6V82_02915, partial [Clostridia bacterium]|nr:hypothetical protein [Clostridia bacterium]